jgi:hypothetical protein
MCEPGHHRFEWSHEREGIITWVCMNANCGEIQTSFQDTQGG